MIGKHLKLIVFSLFLGIIVLICSVIGAKKTVKSISPSTDAVFVGPEKYASKFEESVGSAKAFSDLFGEALKNIDAKNYNAAISNLNDSLKYVGIGTEISMVYRKLVEIYKIQGNLEKELYYLEQIPKYTMSDRIKKECNDRAQEIRRQLAA